MSRGRGRGRRYEEPKLNMKKVFAVIIAFVVFIMFIFMIKNLLTNGKESGKITSKDYFVAYQNAKWGVIDSNGEIVIDPSYAEMIVIPNKKQDVFLCIYDVDYENGIYKTKALNSKNEEIFTQYEKIEGIQNQDSNLNLWYEENAIKVMKDGKYGLIDFTGKELTECQYEEIVALDGVKNIFKVKKDGKYGLVDKDGKEIVSTQYLKISNLGKDGKDGYIVQNEAEKYGIVDAMNNIVLEAKYDSVEKIYGNEQYVVKIDGKNKLVKKDGTEVISVGFDEIKGILKSSENGIIYVKDGKYGVMKLDGQVTIDAQYESLKESKSGLFIAKKDNKYGVIDLEKNEKMPFNYKSLTYYEKADIYVTEDENFNNIIFNNNFEEKQKGILLDIDEEKGYIEIRQEGEINYYNLKFENKKESDIFTTRTLFINKKDGKYGFVDKDGKEVVECIYDDAVAQNLQGFCAVKKDGKWGSIDTKGNLVQEPTYNLDQYLKIDFIGRWHFGKDINMNYYNQI